MPVSFPPLLRVVFVLFLSVKQQLSSSGCFVRATTGNCSSSARMLFLKPDVLHPGTVGRLVKQCLPGW